MGGSCISGSVSRSAGWGGADRIQSPSEQPCPVLNASSARPCASTLYLHHIVPSQAHKAGPAFARFWRRGNRGAESSRALARAALLASGRVGLGCRPLEATAFRPPPGWGFGTFGAGGPLPARDCSGNSARPRPGEGAEGRLETGELAPLGDGLRCAELRWEALGRALRRTQGLGSLYSPQAVFLWPADVGYNFTGYGKQAGSKWLELCGLNSVYSSWLSENWTLVPVGCGPKEVNIGLIPECCFWLIIIPGTAARTPRARAVKRCEPVLSVDQAK